MSETNNFSFDRLLELLAERLASRLSQEPDRLYPRLMTLDQAAVYLGHTRDAVQHLLRAEELPAVLTNRRVFLDRLDLDRWISDHKTGWV